MNVDYRDNWLSRVSPKKTKIKKKKVKKEKKRKQKKIKSKIKSRRKTGKLKSKVFKAKTKIKPKRKFRKKKKIIKPKRVKHVKQYKQQHLKLSEDLVLTENDQMKEQEIMDNNLKFLNKEIQDELEQDHSSDIIEPEQYDQEEGNDPKLEEISREEEMLDNLDKEKISEEIPKIKEESEEELEFFKESIVNLIFKYEIFGENEFNQFFDMVTNRNSHLPKETIEVLFEDVKKFLYDQFRDEIEDFDENE